ncbi:hypothetical protein QAD02_002994 [Eretmocerus hayati]|uniref:Uncharacterized protein n=1 Tax=Eretmocerus hayati TaxID=131215 RepID=A0ACC2NKN2_9HYME|nr:hypothetical protein QAD02_002994 [Eretmocerus hayati]
MSIKKRSLEEPIDIADINPYLPNIFIKAKITSKTSVEVWSKNEKKSNLFSVQLLDHSGEMRMTFSADQCTSVYEKIEVGNIYDMRNTSVKKSIKKYNDIDHKFELNATKSTLIQKNESTPVRNIKLKFHFEDHKSILSATDEKCKDVIAVIKETGEIVDIHSRENNEIYERMDIEIVD